MTMPSQTLTPLWTYTFLTLDITAILLVVIALGILLLLIKSYKKASMNISFIYLLNGTLVLGAIRIFFILVDDKIVHWHDITLMTDWHLLFYLATAIFFLAGKALIELVDLGKPKPSFSKANLMLGVSCICIVGLLLLSPFYDNYLAKHVADTWFDRFGVFHLIAFITAGLVAIYMSQIKRRFQGYIQVVTTVYIALAFMSSIHLWELLTESWKIITVSDNFGELIERLLWIPVFIAILYTFARLRNLTNANTLTNVSSFSSYTDILAVQTTFSNEKQSNAIKEIDKIISYMRNLINREDLISAILTEYEQCKKNEPLNQGLSYVATYIKLENFILTNKPVIIKKEFTKTVLREEIKKNSDIQALQPELKLLFVTQPEKNTLLLEKAIQILGNFIVARIGTYPLSESLSAISDQQIRESIQISTLGMNFDQLNKNFQTEKIGFILSSLKEVYLRLLDQIAALLGAPAMKPLLQHTLEEIKNNYDEETYSDFLQLTATSANKINPSKQN